MKRPYFGDDPISNKRLQVETQTSPDTEQATDEANSDTQSLYLPDNEQNQSDQIEANNEFERDIDQQFVERVEAPEHDWQQTLYMAEQDEDELSETSNETPTRQEVAEQDEDELSETSNEAYTNQEATEQSDLVAENPQTLEIVEPGEEHKQQEATLERFEHAKEEAFAFIAECESDPNSGSVEWHKAVDEGKERMEVWKRYFEETQPIQANLQRRFAQASAEAEDILTDYVFLKDEYNSYFLNDTYEIIEEAELTERRTIFSLGKDSCVGDCCATLWYDENHDQETAGQETAEDVIKAVAQTVHDEVGEIMIGDEQMSRTQEIMKETYQMDFEAVFRPTEGTQEELMQAHEAVTGQLRDNAMNGRRMIVGLNPLSRIGGSHVMVVDRFADGEYEVRDPDKQQFLRVQEAALHNAFDGSFLVRSQQTL